MRGHVIHEIIRRLPEGALELRRSPLDALVRRGGDMGVDGELEQVLQAVPVIDRHRGKAIVGVDAHAGRQIVVRRGHLGAVHGENGDLQIHRLGQIRRLAEGYPVRGDLVRDSRHFLRRIGIAHLPLLAGSDPQEHRDARLVDVGLGLEHSASARRLAELHGHPAGKQGLAASHLDPKPAAAHRRAQFQRRLGSVFLHQAVPIPLVEGMPADELFEVALLAAQVPHGQEHPVPPVRRLQLESIHCLTSPRH